MKAFPSISESERNFIEVTNILTAKDIPETVQLLLVCFS
jgi:hypothetical protein